MTSASSGRVRTKAGPVAVPEAGRLGRPLVAGPPQEGRHLVLDRALEDELGAEAFELTQLVGTVEPIEQDLLDRRGQPPVVEDGAA